MANNLKKIIVLIFMVFVGVSFAGCKEAKDYSVQFFANGKLVETFYYNHGEEMKNLPQLSSNEVELLGWYNEYDGSQIKEGTNITKDLVLTARTSVVIEKNSGDWLSDKVINLLKSNYKVIFKTKGINQINRADISLISSVGIKSIDFSNASFINNHFPEDAFLDNSSIEHMVLPKTVTTMGSKAFFNAVNLRSIDMSGNIQTFGDYVFYNCDSLISLVFPASTLTIGKGLLSQASSIITIQLDSKITNLSRDFVDGASSLQNIEIINSNIESKYFSNSGMLYFVEKGTSGGSETRTTKLVRVPEGVSGVVSVLPQTGVINEKAFFNAKKITKVNLSNADSLLYEIESQAFFGCQGLKEVDLGNTLVEIGDSAFENCNSLSTIDFSKATRLEKVGDFAFKNTSSLQTIEFAGSLKSLGDYSFYNCTNLASVVFNTDDSQGSLIIGEYAFYKDSYMNETIITIKGSIIPIIGRLAFGIVNPINEGVNNNKVKIIVNDRDSVLLAWSEYILIELLVYNNN